MADKLLKYDVAMKSTKTVWQMETPRCYTGDENTVTFDFNITDLEAADLVGVIPNVYLYMRDGSFFQNGPADGVEITGTIVNYTMKGNEGKHSGIARAQLVLVWDDEINPPEKLTSQLYDFEVVSGLENKVAVEVMIQDWTTLTREARTFIDTSSDEVDALKGELQTAINTANASLGEFDVALETGIVAANLAEKLEDFEEINNSRLLSTERQLAEKATKNATFANASDKLNIFNYLGNVENIHPKVLYFPDKWNGWKYWIAYTPYPGGQTMYENPCLSCSNDGINWVDPSPTINPLYQVPADGYNSDTHIVYNGAELEVWWRTFSTDNSSKYYRRKSSDGLIWQVAEEMFSSVTYGKDMISPAIIFEDGKYKLWAISGAQIKYNESTNGKNWNILDEKTCVTNWGNITPWHIDVIHTSNGYEAVVQGYTTGGDNNHANLYYISSIDNTSYSDPLLIINPSLSPDGWDNQGIYRSSIVMVDGLYYIYYSGISKNNARAISLSVGKEINNLKGYDSTGTGDFRYKPKSNGYYLPKVTISAGGNGYLGSYMRASKDFRYTAQILGEKKQVDSGGLQISTLYLDHVDKANSEGLLMGVQGQIRSRGTYAEFYDGATWNVGFKKPRGVKVITAPATVDLDITDTRLVVFNGTGSITINSVSGGTVQEDPTVLMIDSSGVTVTIPDNGTIINEGRSTVTLSSAKVSCNIMRMASSRWRTF